MYEYVASMFVCAPQNVCLEFIEAKRGCWIRWNWKVVLSWCGSARNWPRSSERASSPLNHQAHLSSLVCFLRNISSVRFWFSHSLSLLSPTRISTTILSAAIIDDIIGIIVLTFVIGFKSPESKPVTVLVNTMLFFVFAIVIGFLCYKLFQYIDNKYPHTRRIPIMGLALCFAMAYIAEKYFGIADITGAYVAGIILCSIRDSEYIAAKMDTNSYMLFGPVFFASIGLIKMSDCSIYS